MKIIYMGTPDFAVGPLKALIGAGHDVVCVLTRADKPKGRGHAVQFSPVKEAALEAGIPVLQPVRMKDPELWKTLEDYGADLFVVAAYGRILPKEILSIPKYGCVNIHASLLPDYRGAAPIQWAVIDGRKESGVTTMLMNEGLDTGDILRQYRITLADNETGGSLFDKLAALGSVCYVNGNHEADLRTREAESFYEKLSALGIRVLRDRSALLPVGRPPVPVRVMGLAEETVFRARGQKPGTGSRVEHRGFHPEIITEQIDRMAGRSDGPAEDAGEVPGENLDGFPDALRRNRGSCPASPRDFTGREMHIW